MGSRFQSLRQGLDFRFPQSRQGIGTGSVIKVGFRFQVPFIKVGSRFKVPVIKVGSRLQVLVIQVGSSLQVPVINVGSRFQVPVIEVGSRFQDPVNWTGSRFQVPGSSKIISFPVLRRFKAFGWNYKVFFFSSFLLGINELGKENVQKI